MTEADIIILGAGAAGLAAAIAAGEAAHGQNLRILLLEGARKPGAKILVSGGGRCNVTNARVTPEDFCGGPRPIIRSVLKSFDERRARSWFASLGVELKLEPEGKLFPVTDEARTVLEALLRRTRELGVELLTGQRIESIEKVAAGWKLRSREGDGFRGRRLIVATGGLSLPKSGSDGAGLNMVRELGHAVIPTTPALVPLILKAGDAPGGRFADLSGITIEARLAVLGPRGRKLAESVRGLVFTHFGVSGPAPMDLSRHWLRARLEHPGESSGISLGVPSLTTMEAADAWLRDRASRYPRRGTANVLTELWPEQLARLLAGELGAIGQLRREERLDLARMLAGMPLDVLRDRGYAFAETTAGGVELREIDPKSMRSRIHDDLYLCGEMLDVDGRIGGFSFQWAWASGRLAGKSAAESLG